MKKITLLASLLATGLCFGQVLPIDFSVPEDEFTDAGSVFNIVPGPVDQDNPVGEIIGGGGQFDNVQLELAQFVDFSGDETVITFRFWNPVEADMPGLLQFAGSSDGSPAVEVPFTATQNGEWQEFSLDFANAGNAFPFCGGCPQEQEVNLDKYSRIVLFTDFNATTSNTYFIDDIAGGGDGGSVVPDPEPSEAAPAPTADSDNVISLFSDAYDDVPVNTFRAGFSQADFEQVEIATNPTLKYSSLTFVGIETLDDNAIDLEAAGMQFVNFDIWTPNMTSFAFKLVDFKGDGFDDGSNNTEATVTLTPVLNEWNSVSIPLSDFEEAGMDNFSDINQIIIAGDPSGSALVYVDNLFFSTQSTASNNDIAAAGFKVYPNPSSSEWNITSDNNDIQSIEVYSLLGNKVSSLDVETNVARIDNTGLAQGVYLAKVNTAAGSTTIKLIKK
ncbi:T9SS type A sorting domain-containing protein [Nonlabens ponticola]|uniref:T9SS type A sorting domain-containing protein n=1 Tax=Nonlabens ponticola TaxID=2496866 RepID=A0A3S9N037_9FLAO|nr:T9SS type A sorting domain-containing protein [Nonlabens ponticola]AZQ44905.1 T9SS type A sorting domain-containing protein [Nonlabens ponticola]